MFYTKNTQGDFGTYRCISKNSIGQAEEVVELYGQFPDHQYGGDWIVVMVMTEAEELLQILSNFFSEFSYFLLQRCQARSQPTLCSQTTARTPTTSRTTRPRPQDRRLQGCFFKLDILSVECCDHDDDHHQTGSSRNSNPAEHKHSLHSASLGFPL